MATEKTLTDAKIAALKPPKSGYVLVNDRDGLALRVTEAGGKTFVLNYRTIGGQRRRMTVGDWRSEFGIAHARAEASRLALEIAQGGDPLGAKVAAKIAFAERPTVADLARDFLKNHVAVYDRPRTVAEYQRALDAYVLPAVGGKAVADVTTGDCAEIVNAVRREHPVLSNRVRAVLSVMFSHAIAVRGWIDRNPVNRAIRRHREQPRERYLSDDEFQRLDAALAECRNQQAADVIRFLYWVGSRRGETLNATWDEFDLERGRWTKPSHHTKQNRTHTVALHPQAVALLRSIKERQRPDEKFVFPGDGDRPLKGLKKTWRTLMRRAEIQGFRVHDLRHSFASRLINSGATLPEVGSLLGHTQPATTQRYAHLSEDAQRRALERLPSPKAA